MEIFCTFTASLNGVASPISPENASNLYINMPYLNLSKLPYITFISRNFPLDTFNQVTNSHTRGDSVRIDNNVGCKTFARKRHVFLPVLNSACTLLPMARRKFVADLRNTYTAHSDLAKLVSFAIQCQHHLIDYTSLTVSQESRRVAFRKTFRCTIQLKDEQKKE